MNVSYRYDVSLPRMAKVLATRLEARLAAPTRPALPAARAHLLVCRRIPARRPTPPVPLAAAHPSDR
mgnify:CR=1 FL=1